MKKTIIAIIVVVVLITIGVYMYTHQSNPAQTTDNGITNNNASSTPAASDTQNQAVKEADQVVIGKSVQGHDIIAYNYGTGDTHLLFIGGVHGGYSWNTALLAYQTMDYLKAHPEIIPSDVTVTIIPVLNPDGLVKAAGTSAEFSAGDVSTTQSVLLASRTNANGVDISRNFDCDWKSNAVWQTTPVSGGASAFSEPESQAIKSYVESHKVSAAVVWYSAAGGVFASKCDGGIMPETSTLNTTYANATGYKANNSYDYYATTGDLVNWLAKVKIPAVSVLLTTHTDTELTKNIKGLQAVIGLYSKK